MHHRRAVLIACILSAGLAACGDTSDGLLAPKSPRLNGFTFGSGHRSGSDSTSTATAVSGETTAYRAGPTIGTGH